MADGTERYPLEAVEAMFNSLFPDEFRGIIPIFDHREVDRLLDERDELLNAFNKLKERQNRSYQTMYAKRSNDVMTAVDAARALHRYGVSGSQFSRPWLRHRPGGCRRAEARRDGDILRGLTGGRAPTLVVTTTRNGHNE